MSAFFYRKDIQKVMQERIDVTMAIEIALDVVRKIILKRCGPCLGTERFIGQDAVTQSYLKTHFINRKTLFCSSWIAEEHSTLFLDKIHCGPPPMKWIKVEMQEWDSNGTFFRDVLVSDRDIFPSDQDVFRLTGENWAIYTKGDRLAVVKSDDDAEWLGHAPSNFYDVIVDGDVSSLVDDMLMYKLVGFEF